MQVLDLSIEYLQEFHELFSSVIREDLYEYSIEQRESFVMNMYSMEVVERLIKLGTKKILIIIEDGEMVGFLFGDKPFGGVGFASWLGIRKDKRGQGYGRELLSRYEEYCKQNGAHLIEVYTFPKTIKFYEKAGYTEIGRREKGYFGIVNVIMDKVI